MTDGSDHRNLATADVEFDSYAEYLDERLAAFFDRDRVSSVTHEGWDYVLDARKLFEDGEFGRLCAMLDRQPSQAKWEHMKHADCLRCGEPDVGIIGVTATRETPRGELVTVDQHSELCQECSEQVLEDIENTGSPQPTISAGKWWPGGEPVVE